MLNTTKFLIYNIKNDFLKLSITPIFAQTHREKSMHQKPRLRNPYWFTRKARTIHEDFVTPENKTFVKEYLHDIYGPSAIIGGVQTFQKPLDENSLIKLDEQIQVKWEPKYKRCGAIARKIGQYPLWKKDGTKIRTTLLQIVDNHVIKYIPPEKHQNITRKPFIVRPNTMGCLLMGAESTDPSKFTKEYCSIFYKAGIMPKNILARFLISPEAALLPGTQINVTHFNVGDTVDVRGKTVDRGFQGVIVRHGFKGMPASHGVTKTHRRGGNVGAGGQKARIWPGTKMPGHMGNRYRIARGLQIWRINTKYNVMWVTGSAIPGETNDIVYIYDTLLPLRKHKEPPPFPTNFNEITESTAEDIWHPDIHDFKDETILFKPE